MGAAGDRARRTGPRELSVAVTPRYRFLWGLNRLIIGIPSAFASAASSTFRRRRSSWSRTTTTASTRCSWSVTPLEPRITWFGPREADFSHGFKNRLLAFFGGVIPYNSVGLFDLAALHDREHLADQQAALI